MNYNIFEDLNPVLLGKKHLRSYLLYILQSLIHGKASSFLGECKEPGGARDGK